MTNIEKLRKLDSGNWKAMNAISFEVSS